MLRQTIRVLHSHPVSRRHLSTSAKPPPSTPAPAPENPPARKFVGISSTSLLPDVNSTSLGIEDPLTNDPLKWKKFAIKYAGAVALFLVSYKALHWYVDRLEADGKRRKQEMEENKGIVRDMQPASPAAPQIKTEQQPQQQQQVFRPFDVVQEEKPGQVSQLEELFVYLAELQAREAVLSSQNKSKETKMMLAEIKLDIEAVRVEIQQMGGEDKLVHLHSSCLPRPLSTRLSHLTPMSHKATVLSMYRKVLRISRTWEPAHERQYILTELRKLVRQNATLSSPSIIARKLDEFESRVETALHYNIPYPRPINVLPGSTGKHPQTITPVYLHSYQTPTSTPRQNSPNSNLPVYDD